ncbi:MAG: RND transporter [Gammaproteobacteria bacterium]|nr:MAG: RND transporter [Gammaproteobacteria bacterium]
MNSLIAWFAENRVAANLLMFFILIAGALSLPETRMEILPSVASEHISISVPYPGASPSEVEESVVARVESAIYDLEGIEVVTSLAKENIAIIQTEIKLGYDVNAMLEQIKARVEGISGLPEQVGKTLIQRLSVRIQASRLIISGPADERSLKHLAEQVREDLLAKPGISSIEVGDVRPYEISIELSELELQRYGLSFAEVVHVINSSSLDSSAGAVGTTSVSLRGKESDREGFENLVIRSDPSGGRILLSDIAHVEDGFKKSHIASRFNEDPAVSLRIFRVGDQSILELSETIDAYIENPGRYIPEGISMHVWEDTSKYFRSRINLLLTNAITGFCLMVIILLSFLRLRLSFWTSLGIPISFFGAFWLLPYFGGSFNMISLFAFILVLGIVVDDAIIIGENIFTHNRRGNLGLSGAVQGAQEMAKPVVFAVVTTMVAFSPLLFLPGWEGKLILAIPVVVICTLAFSLVESLLILPAHLSTSTEWKKPEDTRFVKLGLLQQKFSNGLEHFISERFRPFLEMVLRWRYASIASFIALFFVAMAIILNGWVNIKFFSEIEGDVSVAKISFATGTPVDITAAAVRRVEVAARLTSEELKAETGEDQIFNVVSAIGRGGEHKGKVTIELAPSESRTMSGEEISRRWREKIGVIANIESLDINSTLNQSPPSIDLELYGQDTKMLQAASAALRTELMGFPGVYEVQDSFQRGKDEVYVTIKPAGRDLGLNLSELALQVRQAFHGTVVQSLTRGDAELKVVVRYPEHEQNSLWHLENMNIRLPNGGLTPLLTVADVEYGRGPSVIKHTDRKRVIKVQARVDETVVSEADIMEDLRAGFLSDLPYRFQSIQWQLSGSQKQKSEALAYLKKSYLFALVIMYILMATLFRSYSQPLMVMFAIPFGLIGALGGHLLVGIDVTLWSLIGMVAVSGVVVNDTLVLVDYVNGKRIEGVPLDVAIRDAGAARFRPIMLTSLTTFAGVTPLMLEKSLQAQFMIPMAVSLAFGVMFATVVSLVLVPAAYYVLDDIKSFFGMRGISHFVNAVETPEPVVEVASDKEEEASNQIHDSDTLQWHIGLDEAYELGYEKGLTGAGENDCPYKEDEVAASWEAGWDDGYEIHLKKNSKIKHEVPA